MSDVIGRGVIEVSADSSKLTAGINTAKKSLEDLGVTSSKVTKQQSASIDRYVKQLGVEAVTIGKTGRELELYRLALKGASAEQLKAADSALKLTEAYKDNEQNSEAMRKGLLAIGTAAATGLIAAAVAFDRLVKSAGDFQDLAEKTGDTAENIASLSVAAATAGTQMDTIVSASNKLTKALSDQDEESGAAGAAIRALGLDFDKFKQMAPADRIEAIGKAMAGFKDGSEKSAVAMALFGKAGAELLPFLKEIGAEGGRQVILTQTQIEQADEYADKQARMRQEMTLTAQSIAAELLPAVSDYTAAIAAMAEDQQFASTALGVLKSAITGALIIFETIAVLASEVGFVFKMTGNEIGAMAAQLNALVHLDFAGFTAIGDAVKEDAKRARGELDRFQKDLIAAGSGRVDALARPAAEAATKPAQRPALDISGLNTDAAKKKRDDRAQIAKSQLAADIEMIKAASDAQIAVYASAERILDAKRAAGIVSEREAFQAKAQIIKDTDAAREAALEKELARLQREKLSGAAKIDNDKKIADTQAKLIKSRLDSATNLQVIAIQEEAANRKIAQSYVDATEAARLYLDAVRRSGARKVAGIGAGEEERGDLEAFGAMQEKLEQERAKLDTQLERKEIDTDQYARYLELAQSTYSAEADAYIESRDRIKAAQADWTNGASEAWENYKTKARDVAAQSEAAFTGAFDGLTSGIASSISQAIVYGKSLEDSMKAVALSVADAFISAFIKIAIQQMVLNMTTQSAYAGSVALEAQAQVAMAGLNAFASTAAIPIVGPLAAPAAAAAAIAMAEPMAAAATAAAAASVVGAREIGGPVGAGGLYRINEKRPEVLSQDGKDYLLMGDKGGIIRPNTDPSANLSGRAPAGESPVTIINQTTGRVDNVVEQRLSNGERALIIQETTKAVASQITNPNSPVSRSLGANYRVQRSRG